MQLRRLASLERQKILDEYAEVSKTIDYLKDLLAHPKKIMELIQEDIIEVKKKYADPRRTMISEQAVLEFREEDLIPHERVAVTLSNRGFIKRVSSQAYRVQHRGGKGIIGMVTREADAVRLLLVGDTHDTLLFFTNRGKVYSLKCHELPHDSSRTAKGTAVVNLFPVSEQEKVTAIMGLTSFTPGHYFLMATRRGEIKKTAASNFAIVRSNGLIAMDLETGDDLIDVALATEQDDVILVTQKGQSIRFGVPELRTSSRTSGGVRGIRLTSGDQVVSMDTAITGAYILVVTANGYGKLTPVSDYPHQHRAGSGVTTLKLTEKTGDVAAARLVTQSQQLMLISTDGIVTRTPVKEKSAGQGIPIYNRSTQGVRLMRLGSGDRVVAIANFDV
jgi:DNA gyrase subunit A